MLSVSWFLTGSETVFALMSMSSVLMVQKLCFFWFINKIIVSSVLIGSETGFALYVSMSSVSHGPEALFLLVL